jgi:hypothetical protein
MIVLALEIVALTYRCPSCAAPAHLSRPEGYRRSQEKTSPLSATAKQTGKYVIIETGAFTLDYGSAL